LIKEAETSLDRKRSLEEEGEDAECLKKQRTETMWRDVEGDIAVVETDIFLEQARLPGQPRLIK